MIKLKTHSGSSKRFKLTKSGKIKFKKSGLRHLLASKNSKRRRSLRKSSFLVGKSAESVRKLMPYAKS